jgi:cell wall-associated NlpC family hydrolase
MGLFRRGPHEARTPRALPRRSRSLLTTVVAGLVAAVSGIQPTVHAYAAPSVSEIEAQIEQLWNKLEPLIEQYNTVHYQLGQNKAKSAALAKQIAPLRMEVELALTRVGALSAKLYMRGPGAKLNAILQSGSPTTFLEQLSTLNQIARHEEKSISSVVGLVQQYDKQKQPLDALVALQQQQDADLAGKKAQIESQLAQLQKLRLQAYGSTTDTGALRPVACPYEYIGGAAGKAVAYACSHIGAPYRYAASGPSAFDCSGLTMASWGTAGVSLAHSSSIQKTQTARVGRADLRPGDLVFFYGDVHHVGIYVGGGWMVHAPHEGDYVRMAKIDEHGSINSYGRPA